MLSALIYMLPESFTHLCYFTLLSLKCRKFESWPSLGQPTLWAMGPPHLLLPQKHTPLPDPTVLFWEHFIISGRDNESLSPTSWWGSTALEYKIFSSIFPPTKTPGGNVPLLGVPPPTVSLIPLPSFPPVTLLRSARFFFFPLSQFFHNHLTIASRRTSQVCHISES